jgi:hypothetical protein
VRYLVVNELANHRKVWIAQVSKYPHPDQARPLEHDRSRLEGLEKLVAEVGDLLDDPTP